MSPKDVALHAGLWSPNQVRVLIAAAEASVAIVSRAGDCFHRDSDRLSVSQIMVATLVFDTGYKPCPCILRNHRIDLILWRRHGEYEGHCLQRRRPVAK